MRKTEAERFWDKVDKNGPMFEDSACWLWTAYANIDGYGQFRLTNSRKTVRAHRWAYETLRRSIPTDLEIDHLCRNRSCVNPDHLEPVEHALNIQRGLTSALRPGGVGGEKGSVCINGHPYGAENVYIAPSGARLCRKCARAHQHKYYAKKKSRLARIAQ